MKRAFRIASVLRGDLAPPAPFTVEGKVVRLRSQKHNTFVDVNDGSCPGSLQVFLPTEGSPAELGRGCAVRARGRLSSTPRGQVELHADSLEVVAGADLADYPFDPRKEQSAEYIRRYLHLRPATARIASALRVRDSAASALRSALSEEGYFSVSAPVLTSGDCEGAGEVFSVEKRGDPIYFPSETYLTVSGQLHIEAAAQALGRVYSFGPTFRSENSKSRLHLSEFYMLEAETAFVDDLDDVRSLLERTLKSATRRVLDERADDVHLLREDDVPAAFHWLDKPFARVTYDDAFRALRKHSNEFENPLEEGGGLGKEHELALVRLMGDMPTFVVDWPKKIKPFYMRSTADDDEKVAALDLLVPITGEVAGGSLRENDYERLRQKLPSPGMDWYLELRKYGGAPTGGFGLGFERYLQFLCRIPNIKDTIPFPRWPHNCSM